MLFIPYLAAKVLAHRHFRNLQDSQFEHLFGLLPDTVLLLDSKGLVEKANPEARRWFASHHMEPAQYVNLLDDNAKSQLLARIPLHAYEMSYILNTQRLYLTVLIDYIQLSGEQRTLLILRDDTEHKQKIAELERLANHDPLTGLPSRRLFIEHLEAALQQSPQHQDAIIVMLIQLDRITVLNHTHGHVAGNMVLRQMAQTLSSITSERGMTSRMSGDEFILYRSVSASELEIQAYLSYMQEELTRSLTKFSFNPIDINVGISYYPSDGTDAQALINIADLDMIERRRTKALMAEDTTK